jgi:hypothetical protein
MLLRYMRDLRYRLIILYLVTRCRWSASSSGRFTSREEAPGIHWIGGWVGHRAVLHAVEKRILPYWESNPGRILYVCLPIL